MDIITKEELMNIMRVALDEGMKKTIVYIPNNEDYDATYEICAATVKSQVRHLCNDKELGHLKGVDAHFAANNMTVKHLNYLKEANPALAQDLFALGKRASELRTADRISMSSVSVKYPVLSRVLKGLIFIALLPYLLPVSLLSLPILGVCRFLFTKLKDYAFRNSVRYFINLVLWPVLVIIYSIIAYVALPWQWALPVTLLLLPAPIVAHELARILRLFVSDVKLLRNKELRECYREIRNKMFS